VPRLFRPDVHYLLIVSRGSSSNVARYMQYLFGTANRLTVAFATPSLYTVYDAPPELGRAAAIGISQSESRRTSSPCSPRRSGSSGRRSRSRTNRSLHLRRTRTGCSRYTPARRRAVRGTKTYLNSIAAVALALDGSRSTTTSG
jgi:glucosamine--fructose-6-phosphate aminotransferase (isomerizing)